MSRFVFLSPLNHLLVRSARHLRSSRRRPYTRIQLLNGRLRSTTAWRTKRNARRGSFRHKLKSAASGEKSPEAAASMFRYHWHPQASTGNHVTLAATGLQQRARPRGRMRGVCVHMYICTCISICIRLKILYDSYHDIHEHYRRAMQS